MVIAPEETVEKTNNAFSSEHSAPGLSVCAALACDDVLELGQGITGGRNVLFALIYHWDMAFESTYPVSSATQQYQMEPVGTKLSNKTLL